jgi:uncharacterized protein YrrD
MIRGSQLVGRAVVDMDAANRLGKIKEIIVQRDGERVAGFIVAHGETVVGTGGKRRIIPASALHSIGPDAVTVHSLGKEEAREDLDALPRMSDVVGHKMVTRSGRLLGSIDDLLINPADGTIIGYAVGEGVRGKLENIFHPERSRIHGYVRADSDFNVGNDLIVVPDDALIEGEPKAREIPDKSPAEEREEVAPRSWADRDEPQPAGRSIWTRRSDEADPAAATRTEKVQPADVTAGNRARSVPVESERATGGHVPPQE